jgi:hypothetical protein
MEVKMKQICLVLTIMLFTADISEAGIFRRGISRIFSGRNRACARVVKAPMPQRGPSAARPVIQEEIGTSEPLVVQDAEESQKKASEKPFSLLLLEPISSGSKK